AIEAYEFVRDFVGTVAQAGARTFIVHARNAVLRGLSPKENREIPPLRYEHVHRLKRDFPQLEIVINGGFATHESIEAALGHVDGVMLGRLAYHDPFALARIDAMLFGGEPIAREQALRAMRPYVEAELAR